jgi:hypothetical protein
LVLAGCSNGGPQTAAANDKVICNALKQSPADEQRAAHDPTYQKDYLIHVEAALKRSGPDASTRKLRSEAATLATALKPLNINSKALPNAVIAVAVTCEDLGYLVPRLTAGPVTITSSTVP